MVGDLTRRIDKLEAAFYGPLSDGTEPPNPQAEAALAYELARYMEGESGLVWDEASECFYTRAGELAISKTYANIQHVFKSLEDLSE